MATKKSSLLTTGRPLSEGPPDKVDGDAVHANLRVISGTVALATGDLDSGDIVMLCALPLEAVVHQIWLANDALDSASSATADLGLYEDVDGGTAKDADVYATDITQLQSAASFTDLAFEARNINEVGQAVWQDAGDSTRQDATNDEYYLGLTIGTTPATAASGDVSFMVVYSQA